MAKPCFILPIESNKYEQKQLNPSLVSVAFTEMN